MPTAIMLVNGPPAAGKTTLARPLAVALDWPLVSKDVIKEALVDELGAGDRPWSQHLGAATYNAMWALARDMPRVVLEANFSAQAIEPIAAFGCPIAKVFCHVDEAELLRRFRTRPRHPAHLDDAFSDDDVMAWATVRPLAIGPVLRVDTSQIIDIGGVADWVRAAVGA